VLISIAIKHIDDMISDVSQALDKR